MVASINLQFLCSQNLAQHEKKETGSLVTRNLGPIVNEEVCYWELIAILQF